MKNVKRPLAPSRESQTTRGHGVKFVPISEEMKQWSALLQAELNAWPGITTRSMFGFLFFYRRGTVFAALPKTRGFDSPSSLLFKFGRLPLSMQKRSKADLRIDVSMKASSKGWFAFRLESETDMRDALLWLNHAYEAAKKRR